jgi:hypothetical protein
MAIIFSRRTSLHGVINYLLSLLLLLFIVSQPLIPSFLSPGTSPLEPMVHRTIQVASFILLHVPYYV